MHSVSGSELKARLSHYGRVVREGGEVQVLDRGTPVARLLGLEPGSAARDERREELIGLGALRPGSGDASSILAREAMRLDADLSGALHDEREDRV